MLVNTGLAPVVNIRDYTMSVTPQDGYLKIDGEYHISSNWNIPDNLIELQYKLPSQLVDKVFLKTTGRSCNSPDLNLKCSIYKSSSFIDVKNDRALNDAGKRASHILLETNFFLNKQVNHNVLHHDFWRTSELNLLRNQIFKNSFKTNLPVKNYYFLSESDINKSSGDLTLDLMESTIIRADGSQEYKYQKVGFYLSKWSEIISGLPVLSAWELPEKTSEKISLKIKTLTGRMILRESGSNRYTNIDLTTLTWKINRNKKSLLELTQDKQLFSLEKINYPASVEIDIVLSISKDDWTNIVQLKVDLSDLEKDFSKRESSISIDPYDPLLRNLKLDHTWIVEKM